MVWLAESESVLVLAGALLLAMTTTADRSSRRGKVATGAALAGLLVRLLGHLEHGREGLALVRLHRLLDVSHPRRTLATTKLVISLANRITSSVVAAHFIQQARKIPNAGPPVFPGIHPPCGRTNSIGNRIGGGCPT